MSISKQAYRLAMIGPETSATKTMVARFSDISKQLGFEPEIHESPDLDSNGLAAAHRIVLSCAGRADYPLEAIDQLRASRNIVPWAVMTDSWHAGSRRSGAGIVTHWEQPWYRWWDSWLGWFFPEAARPGSLVANAYAPVVTPLDFALPMDTTGVANCDRRLAIVCACKLSASLLFQQAMHAGWSTRVYSNLVELSPAEAANCDLIVWDDSVLPCLPKMNLTEVVDALLNHLTQFAPAAALVAALGLENLNHWQAISERGCVDLLVKPSPALGLSNLLYHRSRQRQLAR